MGKVRVFVCTKEVRNFPNLVLIDYRCEEEVVVVNPEYYKHVDFYEEDVNRYRLQSKDVCFVTWSPIFLDYFIPEEVFILGLDENKEVVCCCLSELPDIKFLLRHFQTGEIVYASGFDEVVSIILEKRKDKKSEEVTDD